MLYKTSFFSLLKYLAIAGNILFVMWVTFNAIDEAFKGTLYQILSYIGLVLLLGLNTFLILRKGKGGN